jgi:4-amino-4-deoxy-L-arabinose transferase-like glycosyltransferase
VSLWRPLGPQLTLWTVFVFATSGLTIAAAKMCITDALLTLWVTIAQLCFFAIWNRNRSWGTVITMWAAVGVAFLTKGPVVLGMMAMTALALTFFEGDWPTPFGWRWNDFARMIQYRLHALKTLRWLGSTRPIAGLLIVAAIFLPWVCMVQIRATGFLLTSFKHEIWDRMLTPLEQHKGPPGYYFLTLWLTFFPWSLFLPLAIGLGFKHRSDPRIRFALAAVIGPWVMLECIQTKLPHYFLPAFPPLAFLTAHALVRCLQGQITDLKSRGFVIVVGIWATVVAIAASGTWVVIHAYTPLPIKAMIALSALGICFGLTVFTAFKARRLEAGAVLMGLWTFVMVTVLYVWYLPNAQFLRVSPRVAQILRQNHVTQKGQVLMLEYMEPSLAFAQGGTIREAGDVGFGPRFEPMFTPWLVVTKSVWDAAPAALRDQFEIKGTVFGLAYADHGKWLTVMVIHRKNRS